MFVEAQSLCIWSLLLLYLFTTSLYLRYACCIAKYILCALCTYIVCSVYILPPLLLYIFTTFLYFIYDCSIQFMCSLYIWPLALLYIFTTFQYFMVSCPTIRCQYWRLTNNKYTFQYNRDKCHRGAHSGKIFSQYLSSQHFFMNIQSSWILRIDTIQIDNYLTRTTCSSLLKLFFPFMKVIQVFL